MTQSPEFMGMQPWQPGAGIIECITPNGRIDLHNDCMLINIDIAVMPGLPTISLHFRMDSGHRFSIAFSSVVDATYLQDQNDWWLLADASVATTDVAKATEFKTFYSVDFVQSSIGLPVFTVNSILGTMQLKARKVEWSAY